MTSLLLSPSTLSLHQFFRERDGREPGLWELLPMADVACILDSRAISIISEIPFNAAEEKREKKKRQTGLNEMQ